MMRPLVKVTVFVLFNDDGGDNAAVLLAVERLNMLT